jgi:hypothetical protein
MCLYYHRDLFTRHGLHLNTKGKEQLALKVAQMIKNLLIRNIALKWKMSENVNYIDKSTELSLGIQDPPNPASQEDTQISLKGSQKDLNCYGQESGKVREPWLRLHPLLLPPSLTK